MSADAGTRGGHFARIAQLRHGDRMWSVEGIMLLVVQASSLLNVKWQAGILHHKRLRAIALAVASIGGQGKILA